MRSWRLPDSYFGAHWDGWFAAPCGVHRDSAAIERANWEAQKNVLLPLDTEGDDFNGCSSTVRVVEANHWAVGWVAWLAIHPSNEAALRAADTLAESLDGYPLLDENLHSEMEYKEAQETWKNFRVKDRIAHLRRYTGAEFDSFADLLQCVRGNFAPYTNDGYAGLVD